MTLAWPFKLQASAGFSLIFLYFTEHIKGREFCYLVADSIKQI